MDNYKPDTRIPAEVQALGLARIAELRGTLTTETAPSPRATLGARARTEPIAPEGDDARVVTQLHVGGA